MASFNSNQLDRLAAVPVQHLRSDEHGRLRAAYFEAPKNATDAPVSTDTFNLVKLPPGARILEIVVANEANAGSSTLDIGIAGATTKYASALAISGALVSRVVICGTFAAPKMGEVQATPVTIIGTVGGATLTANKRICGYVTYLGVE